jgi:gas vesicle protein GvpL/GvpF
MPPMKKARPKAVTKGGPRKAPVSTPARAGRGTTAKAPREAELTIVRGRGERSTAEAEVRMHETLVAATPEGRAPVRPATSTRGKYVYCVIQANEPLKFGNVGLGAEPAEVHTVHYKDIAAVISDTPIEVPDATRENVLAHERVNESVMRTHTVIPMSFGTVFKTPQDIVELLRGAYEAFTDVLHKMQDKLEFGLKLLWDRDVAVREVEKEDEEVRRLKNEIASQKGSTYFARMQYGRLLDAALQARSERYVTEIVDQLRDVSVAYRANKPIGDKMIMNAAFLVSRDQESDFDARVKSLGAKYANLTFRYTGPWPPYNFVNIRLKLERARDSE